MENKKELYGDAIVLLGHFDGWDYGIWYDIAPRSFVFIKPINEDEYVMMCIGPELDEKAYANKVNGTLAWTFMRVDEEYNEIDKEEFDTLVRKIEKKSKRR